jgi:hypothetical protein
VSTFVIVLLVLGLLVAVALAAYWRGFIEGDTRHSPSGRAMQVINDMKATHDATMTAIASTTALPVVTSEKKPGAKPVPKTDTVVTWQRLKDDERQAVVDAVSETVADHLKTPPGYGPPPPARPRPQRTATVASRKGGPRPGSGIPPRAPVPDVWNMAALVHPGDREEDPRTPSGKATRAGYGPPPRIADGVNHSMTKDS